MGRYVRHLGPETPAASLLSTAEPRHIEGWHAALVEAGRNAFLCADFEGASRLLLAALSFVVDQAHPAKACTHCAEGEGCWVAGYYRNMVAQATLATQDEEANFVLEGYQDYANAGGDLFGGA